MRPRTQTLPSRERPPASRRHGSRGRLRPGLFLAACLLCIPATASAGPPDTVRFKSLSVVDREGTGGEAFRILVPEGWTLSGGVQWMPDNPGLPATAAFRVSSPDGKSAFEAIPSQPFFWTNIQKILSEHPRGSRYYGREVLPPMQPAEALKKIVIPRFRPDARHLEVLEERPVPELSAGLGAGILSQPDTEDAAWGGTVRIRYVGDGIQTEERIYAVVQQILFNFSSPTGTQTTMMWNVAPILSFRTDAATFEERAAPLQAAAFSLRWNPDWFNRYCRLVAYMMVRRVERFENTEEMRRILTHEIGPMSDAVKGFHREHQQVYTRIAEAFSASGSRVEAYHVPLTGEDVDLPAGFAVAWASREGEFVLSRDPAFRPVSGPGGAGWTRIRPVRTR